MKNFSIIILFVMCGFTSHAQVIKYVKPGGMGSGTSWLDASSDLNLILSSAAANTQVWVASGIYKPTAYPSGCVGCSTNRDFAFFIPDGVKLYGGFAGTESSISQRNLMTSISTLSGDIGVVNSNIDNAHHIILASTSSTGSGVVIDGFTISEGKANINSTVTLNSNTIAREHGSGIYLVNGNNTISNVKLLLNQSRNYGGGLYANSGSNIISQCLVEENTADRGGGVMLEGSNNTITNSIFRTNESNNRGGSINLVNGNSLVQYNEIYENFSRGYAAGLSIQGGNNTIKNNSLIDNLSPNGGAMLIFSGINQISDNSFFENNGNGGGVLIYGGENTFENNDFTNNSSTTEGGAVYGTGGINTFKKNTFRNNDAGIHGGAIYFYNCTNTLEQNIFENNSVEVGPPNPYNTYGGSIFSNLGSLQLKNNVVANSVAKYGGGIYLLSTNATIINNTFFQNTGILNGGAIGANSVNNNISNNLFWANLKNTSLISQGADYYCFSGNNTFVNNSMQLGSSSYTTSGSGIFDIGTASTGNLFAQNPLFLNAMDLDGVDNIFRTSDDGLMPTTGSPGINAGLISNAPLVDIRDFLRSGNPDLGAYEFGSTCPNSLNVTGTITTNQKAQNSVTSSGVNLIPAGANVTYQAGNYIQLNPGFSTGPNTVFLTKLQAGCL